MTLKNPRRKLSVKSGTTAVITGASSGIGKALAVKLARDYAARLVINARGEKELAATAKLVNDSGGEAVCVVGDVADEQITQQLIDTCMSKYNAVDILVNNAGLTRSGPIASLTPDDWRYVFAVNFFAGLNLIYAALPHMSSQGSGKIVNIASVAGKVAFPGTVCYASSKFALVGLSQGLAAEYASQGIDVITVCPGWVRTEFFSKNNTADDPTAVAQKNDMQGWLMRNILSISSEQAADEITLAMNQGGSKEIVLTAPGVVLERLVGTCPRFVSFLSSLVPPDRSKPRF